MKLFETAFQKDFDYYERVFDTDLNKSQVRKIDVPFEWFEESSQGDFKSITNSEKRYVRKQGSSKQARDKDGAFNPIERQIREKYWKKGFNKNPRIFYLDIETRTGLFSSGFPSCVDAVEPISLIQIFDNHSKTMFIFGERPWKFEDQYSFDYNKKYILCSNEENILEGFLSLYKQLDPLIVYAWNAGGFDFPFIFNRMKNLGMDTDRLSNYSKVKLKSKQMGFKLIHNLETPGHYWMDLLDVYKKFTFGLKSSYSLDNIAFEELGKTKVQHTEYEKFDDFYTGKYVHPENPTEEQLNSNIFKASAAYIKTKEIKYLELVKELAHSEFVYYGAIDTHLIAEIDKKQNFTMIMIMLAEKMGVLISDTLGTVKPWGQNIRNIAYSNKEIIEQREFSDESVQVKGGRVTDPVVGKHQWICSADVNSLYPSLMRAFNMSPEKFVQKHKLPEKLKEYILRYFNDEDEDKRTDLSREIIEKTSSILIENNLCLGINGAVFKTDSKGMIPQLIEDVYTERKQAKKTMLKYEQRKVLLKRLIGEKIGNT